MSFYSDDQSVPSGLQTNEFVLRMLRATDVERDYDAVMASKEDLRLRGGQWPRDGFTLAENLADLERHEQEFYARTSFTYTVMDPDETRCLGCVYLYPMRAILRRFPASEIAHSTVPDFTPYLTFWVRSDYLRPNGDKRLLAAIRTWLAQEWTFPQVLFMANTRQKRHLHLYKDAGLQHVFSLRRPEPAAILQFFGYVVSDRSSSGVAMVSRNGNGASSFSG